MIHPARGLASAAAAAAALCTLLGPAGCDREIRDTNIKLIPVAHVKALADRQARAGDTTLLLIDPRPPKDFERARIPGARNIRLPQVSPRSEVDPTLDRFKTIIVYGDDPASGVAKGMTKRLLAVGYSGVRLYAGGLAEWRRRGYPIEGTDTLAPAPPAAPGEPAPAPPPATPPSP
ncbi:MAG: rhodanese-like domain-containing protein [Phycisphaerales bacterium]